MPIHDVGYRNWIGEKTSQFSRWLVISQTGVRLAAKSAWVRRLLLAAWLPVMWWGIGFFFFENSMKEDQSIASVAEEVLEDADLIPPEVYEAINENAPPPVKPLIPSEKEVEEKLKQGVSEALKKAEELKEKAEELKQKKRERDSSEKANSREQKRGRGKEASGKERRDRERRGKDGRRRGRIDVHEGVDSRNPIAMAIDEQFSWFPHADTLIEAIDSEDKDQIRKVAWRWMLMVFFRYPQSLLILFLIGIVAPSLISRDLRSRAFLMYFSRPIGKLEYLIGKLCIPAVFIASVTTLPALALYLFAIMLSPSLSVFWSTWDIPLRIIGATFALVIPTSALALMLSSLTQESRFANFSWFAVWALGHGAWMAITLATAIGMGKPPFHTDVTQSAQVQNWSVLSLYNCLGDVQSYIFGFETFGGIWRGAAAIFFVTIFSLVVLYRRISAPIRV